MLTLRYGVTFRAERFAQQRVTCPQTSSPSDQRQTGWITARSQLDMELPVIGLVVQLDYWIFGFLGGEGGGEVGPVVSLRVR
jgi:hypothetical protein